MKLLLPWSLCRLASTRNYSAEGIGKQVGAGERGQGADYAFGYAWTISRTICLAILNALARVLARISICSALK
jgi:hypothetical protein